MGRGPFHADVSVERTVPDVWLLGPNAVEFKTFWRALRQLLLQDANASRFTQFEQDALDTYKDYDLTGAYEARRHTYFDVRHAYAWGQFMQMGWIDNKMQQSLFGSILDLESDGYRRRMFAGSLGLMSLVIISQGIPNTVDVDRWAALQAKHDQFCDRWGLPRLGLLPDFVSEA